MKADPAGVLTGVHFMDGDTACAEGAIAAGCRFVAGYPITPSTEVVEHLARRFPLVGGVFIQMEDEIASSIAIAGAAWAGKKTMTSTSGPGLSLMMEHIGFGAMTETPFVIINVQRGGPSTGLPTLPGQADVMQARWGSHGDYEIIAVTPNSPQECFDLTIHAFNLSEKYRVPAIVLLDEIVAHMSERVVIPPADEIEIVDRKYTTKSPDEYIPFEPDEHLVPDFAKAGDGYHFLVTGLTHNEKGYPAMNWEAQEKLVHRLVNKIRLNAKDIYLYDQDRLEDAEVVVVSFGITSRVALRSIELARQKGIKVGIIRLKVIWPFIEPVIREIAGKVRGIVVPEMNYGQLVLEVERCAAGQTKVILVPHGGGAVHNPKDILNAIERAAE